MSEQVADEENIEIITNDENYICQFTRKRDYVDELLDNDNEDNGESSNSNKRKGKGKKNSNETV